MWRKNIRSIKRTEIATAYIFIAVPLIIIFTFRIIPLGVSLILSFAKWPILGSAKFVGLDNFQKLIHDPIFWKSMINVGYYMGGKILPTMFVALFIATVVNRRWYPFKNLFKAIYFAPTIISMTVLSLVWLFILDPRLGSLNDMLFRFFRIQPLGWLSDRSLAMPCIIFIAVWRGIGYSMIIYLAGLQGIPKIYYEAAEIDGATAWSQFRHITWPLLIPTTLFILVISIIGSFQVFDQVYLLTEGGPGRSTMVIVFYIYQNAFELYKMGYASSLAWVLFCFIFGFSIIQFKIFSKQVEF